MHNNKKINCKKDSIFFYVKAVHTDEEGREYIGQDAGKAVDDVWNIPVLTSSDKERIGYPPPQ
ncbi:MAG: hypothetical protein LBF62_06510, partial [Tannerellaceae bacterium]|nr:hypothetical protein [Tannerellaceae bacterium]